MAIELTNQNQWYEIVDPNVYTTTISGATAVWRNVIQARWTSRSGSTYYLEYRAIVRKNSGTLTGNTSSYNGFAIWGTGAPTVNVSADTLRFPNIGDNLIQSYHPNNPGADVYGITYGSINVATAQAPFRFGGGVMLASGINNRWGHESLVTDFTLPPTQYPDPPTLSATVISDTKVILEYGTTSFHDASGSVGLRYSTTSGGPYTLIDSATTTGQHTYIHTGLTPGTTYYYIANSANTTLISWSQEIAVTMVAPAIEPNPKIYGSVNDLTEKADKFYGSVNSSTKKVLKIYGSENGLTKRIF